VGRTVGSNRRPPVGDWMSTLSVPHSYEPSRGRRPKSPPPSAPACPAPARPPSAPRLDPTPSAPPPPPPPPVTAHLRSSTPPKEPRGENQEPKLTEVHQFSVTTEDELAETIFDFRQDPPLVYAVCSSDGTIFTTPSMVSGDKLYLPPGDCNGLIAKGVVLFPSAAVEYGPELQLVSSIIRFIHRYADLPAFWEKLICYFVMMTWVFQRFSALPYLRFLGEPQSGKTRMAAVAASICYRVCSISGATSSAALYRLIESFHGSVAVDEADYGNSDLWSEVAKVFNAGYVQGNPVVKCDSENHPEAFDVFCPKILSARKRFADQATESRCLTLTVYQKPVRPDIALQLPDGEFAAESLHLRNKLLTWRFRNYRRIAPSREIESKLAGLEPRLIQILSPLVAVSPTDPDFHAELKRFFGRASAEQRADSQQALIVEAIRDLMGTAPTKILRVMDVAQQASELRQQQEPEAVREAAKLNGKGHGEEALTLVVTAKQAGYWIRCLGFNPDRTKVGFVFDVTPEKWKEVSERYPPLSVPGRVSIV
jgi:hypothetical protein